MTVYDRQRTRGNVPFYTRGIAVVYGRVR